MDREYLEDYEQKERAEYEALKKRIQEGKFNFEKDRYPPDERFVKLQKPVASVITLDTARISNVWAQVPFCGSLILILTPAPKSLFEKIYFKVTEIPKIIDFIKETGRLQVALSLSATQYEGLDYLDLFFKELNPPAYYGAPVSIFESKKEVHNATDTFYTLGRVKYMDFLWEMSLNTSLRNAFSECLLRSLDSYVTLKLGHYTIAEDIENLMIDDPEKAFALFNICSKFIVFPVSDLRFNLLNFTLKDIRRAQVLPLVYQPQEIRFPYEIGKFLLKKLTYAPQGLTACHELIDHYDGYDLRKVQESLNEAIVTNHHDIVNKSAEELSEILDNVWNDSAIPRRIKNLRRGIPISIAAIGTAVSAFSGGIGGFLAGLGFSVGAAFLKAEIEEISEKVGTFFAKRSYQANVYDFKKKYEAKIVDPL